MARYLAVLVYRLLTRGEAWVDRGAAQYEQRRSKWELANLNSKARQKDSSWFPLLQPARPEPKNLSDVENAP